MIICFDIDLCSCLNWFGGSSWGGRSRTASIDCSHSLYNVYHFSNLALGVLEILDGNDWVLTLVVMVDKRIVQLVVRMSNGAGAKKY